MSDRGVWTRVITCLAFVKVASTHVADDPRYSLNNDDWKRLTEAKYAGV